MKRLLLAVFLYAGVNASGQDNPNPKAVSAFITLVKQQDKQALADKVIYPLRRQYPLPAVNNKQEFLARYSELFDDSLIYIIAHSDPAKDWASGGWRGISLNRGQVWLDDNGKLIGINYQTKTEAAKRATLIEADKNQINPSLRDYKQPVLAFQTDKFKVRIDDMGSNNFRYTSWPVNVRTIDQPEVVIQDGKLIREGSGGNHYFSFENGAYTYKVEITVIGKEKLPPTLTISKGDETIMTQKAKK
ncbi:hypothetical protein SIO70_16430 [Chitinophaga sancti]|uniref:hypothetical protein n=1 Tax=Chitinophaga sancti TaxID=1004 RepID=UPI002A74D2D1|nr:hypothetical protein [Chitinophaga sancti]WPQ66447.1 hypothetical protein SIO70_16430 [Chitinophaga sancti]